MNTPTKVRLCLALAFLGLSAPWGLAADAPPPAADLEFFETHIRPLFVAHCYQCHGPEKQKAGLRLDSRAAILNGGESGPEFVPGKPAESRLIAAVGYQDPDLQMPPKGKLTDRQIEDLTRWVAVGAPWPLNEAPSNETPPAAAKDTVSKEAAAPSSAEAASQGSAPKKEPFDLAARKAQHWAWKAVRPAEPPPVAGAAWVRQPSDQFLLARLEQAGLAPAPAADRRTLIRRATFDLVGLPPTSAEVDAFVNDARPQAWEAVVDRLLASPHFGERWARHWLDLVRYAESRGHEFDYEAPNAYQYRDYVIRAFNADVPYNQFVMEHIAGDLLPQPRMDAARESNESVLGTGFWFLGEWVHSPVDIRQDEMDRVDNQIDVMCKTFLGLTVACARCHDHKFDAISTRDYYSLAGFLHSSSYRDVAFQWQAHNSGVAEQLDALQTATADKVLKSMTAAREPVLEHVADYLLAARELGQAQAAAPAKASSPVTAPEAGTLETTSRAQPADEKTAANDADTWELLVAARGLDAKVLDRWIDEIGRARKDPLHPLHCWAKAADDPQADAPGQLQNLLRGPIGAWQKEQERASVPFTGETIVDYGHLRPGQWISDGLAFGSMPRAAARFHLGSKPEQPVTGMTDGPVADTFGRGAFLPGMLRTETFAISAPTIWYRLRGSADVFLVIDSHRMVGGPLHGSTKKHIESEGWKWHAHIVAPYQGQRAHLEFRPAKATSELAVSACAQGAQAPAEPSRVYEPLLAAIEEVGAAPSAAAGGATNVSPHTLADLAARYQRVFSEACRAIATDGSPAAADVQRLRLAEWCSQHADLFGYGGQTQKHVAGLLDEYQRARGTLVKQIKGSPTAMALLDGSAVDEHVLLRGSPKTPGPAAPRRFLEALGGAEHPPIPTGSGRLDLARQMVDPQDPLVSRVMVNRVWQHVFGRGLVASVDNFGVLGEAPSHPELLDYLANRFVQDGWSVKRLVRGLLLSSAYQMSSRADAAAERADPLNVLLHRANLRRLEGEAIRDALLVVSGKFDPALFGPSVPVYLTAFMEGRGRPGNGPLDGANRRSIYTKIRRNFLSPMMLAFDMPIPFNTMGRRSVSNVPAQALILLNDPLAVQMAERWADRTLQAPAGSAAERVRAMYLDAFAREPGAAELDAALGFLGEQGERLGLPPEKRLVDRRPWADFAHVLINTKEFIFIH